MYPLKGAGHTPQSLCGIGKEGGHLARARRKE